MRCAFRSNSNRDFLKISGNFSDPKGRHPKRPIGGLDFERQEISGTRLWGLLSDIWKTPEEIHRNVFLVNHCPLLLLGETGRNITLTKSLDLWLNNYYKHVMNTFVKWWNPSVLHGLLASVDMLRKERKKALTGLDVEITTCWHPSPASPLANRNDGVDWRQNVRSILLGEG